MVRARKPRPYFVELTLSNYTKLITVRSVRSEAIAKVEIATLREAPSGVYIPLRTSSQRTLCN